MGRRCAIAVAGRFFLEMGAAGWFRLERMRGALADTVAQGGRQPDISGCGHTPANRCATHWMASSRSRQLRFFHTCPSPCLSMRMGKVMPETLSKNPWELRFGARVLSRGGVEFGILGAAPALTQIESSFGRNAAPGNAPEERKSVSNGAGSWRGRRLSVCCLRDGRELPDPVSRWQPTGVHGPSRVVDPRSFTWSDQNSKAIPFKQLIVYELHTAAFTPEGTFKAIIPKLAFLKQLGITAIELMPVAEFPGTRNWDRTGRMPFWRPIQPTGGPDGLKSLSGCLSPSGPRSRARRCLQPLWS